MMLCITIVILVHVDFITIENSIYMKQKQKMNLKQGEMISLKKGDDIISTENGIMTLLSLVSIIWVLFGGILIHVVFHIYFIHNR
jgi:hypothetical protein